MTHTYDVVLDGQLGQRFGQLRWKENGSSVEGMFFLLGVQNPIRGRREGNTLVLTHELKTAVSTLSCQTRAELSGSSLTGIVVTNPAAFAFTERKQQKGTRTPNKLSKQNRLSGTLSAESLL